MNSNTPTLLKGLTLSLALCACGSNNPAPDAANTDAAGNDAVLRDSPSTDVPQRPDSGPAGACPAVNPAGAMPTVFWPHPVRAHPNIPFRYTLVAYEPGGEKLCYSLESAPAGMSIDGAGNIAWAPTDADAAASPFAFTVHVTTASGGHVAVPVSLAVGRAGFVFVAPNGDDTADGSLEHPLASPEAGMRRLESPDVRTVVVRGGTYNTNWVWNVGGVSSPFRGVNFTAENPAEIIGYPDESPVIQCQTGHGLYAFQTSYVLYRDLEVRHATESERGGAIGNGDHVVFQRVTVRDSDWTSGANCTGFLMNGTEVVAHRCVAADNYDRTMSGGALWNSSNYLTYTENPDSSIFVLESASSGSVVGYKIKHGGPGTLTLWGNVDVGSQYGFGGADDGLRVAFNTFVGNPQAIALAITDPSPSVLAGGMTVENNTVVDPTGPAFYVGDSYPGTNLVVRRNVFRVSAALGTQESDPMMYWLWGYGTSQDSMMVSDQNCFFAPGQDHAFRVGSGNSLAYDAWRALGHDSASVWTDPMFAGPTDYRLGAQSGCLVTDGVVPGAWGAM